MCSQNWEINEFCHRPSNTKKNGNFGFFFNVLTFEPHSGHKPVIRPKNTPAGVVFWAVSWDFTKKIRKKDSFTYLQSEAST